jgi:hypothetical protein
MVVIIVVDQRSHEIVWKVFFDFVCCSAFVLMIFFTFFQRCEPMRRQKKYEQLGVLTTGCE